MIELPNPRSRIGALTDVALVLVVFVLTRFVLKGFDFRFPGATAIVATVLLAVFLMRARGAGLGELGLRRPGNWLKIVALNVLGVASIAAVFFGLQPLLDLLGIAASDSDSFSYIEGNLVALILTLLCLAWGTAAFGEELVARGFVLSRLTTAFGTSRVATTGALLVHAVLFGVAHIGQGARGMLTSGAIALVLGAIYLAGGRNLWSVIPVHGTVDTISLVQTYHGSG